MSDTDFPETIESEPQFVAPTALAQLQGAEIDRMVATAKQFPRNLAQVRKKAYHMIVSNEDVAASCSFAVPRGDGVVRGPSARFAEIMVSAWGNCRSSSRIIDEGAEYVTAQGMFYDVENNVAVSCEIKGRIVDRYGKRYSPDGIINAANATGSKAARTAALRGIPQAAWKWLYEQAQATVAGDVKTLPERRDKAFALMKPFGLTPAMICRLLRIEGVSEITTDHLTSLEAMRVALKEKETTVEELMDATYDHPVAEKGQRTVDKIKQKYQKPEAEPDLKKMAEEAQAKLKAKREETKANEPTKASDVQTSLGEKW